ncbi:scramblase Any1p [[Candida] anglica]|uniref:Scramblase Any1p n=1 Tax=[Candida] anglica TaxID=148631 RepID=A0ABP0EGD5_9ASCO
MSYLVDYDYLPHIKNFANHLIIFTPLFSYGTTCYSIYKKQNSDGFSIDICATMLMASILRIFYYVISPYERSLFIQSIVMIFIQCILLKVSLTYRTNTQNPEYLQNSPDFNEELEKKWISNENLYSGSSQEQSDIQDKVMKYSIHLLNYINLLGKQALYFFDIHYKRPKLFWQWSEESKYWTFLFRFTAISGILTLIFHNNEFFGSIMGILGLFIESLLPLPQILLLNRFQSVKNFKVILLLSWLGGDCTKISYLLFGANNISTIFIFAALFQMSLDIVIAFQYFHFKKLNYLENPNSIV